MLKFDIYIVCYFYLRSFLRTIYYRHYDFKNIYMIYIYSVHKARIGKNFFLLLIHWKFRITWEIFVTTCTHNIFLYRHACTYTVCWVHISDHLFFSKPPLFPKNDFQGRGVHKKIFCIFNVNVIFQRKKWHTNRKTFWS